MFKVFVADKLAAEGIAALQEYPQLEIDFSPGLDVEAALAHIADADAVIVRSETKIRGKLLAAASKLRVVGRAGIGVDNIDLDAATERGIVVLNTPDANATTTAELAIAHLFSLSRQLPEADRTTRNGEWLRSKFMGSEVTGKTLGIVGFGTIGRLVAERARGLKMQVLGFDPFVNPQTFESHGVAGCAELDTLLAASDYVTLHCPMTKDTRNLLSATRLRAMKKGARLINCARGGLIDEEALLEVITSGHLAGAALDVFAQEPPGASPLFGHPRIQFTPHLGASTEEAQTATGVEIAHQIAAFLLRDEIRNAVNLQSVPPERLAQLEPYLQLARRLGKLVGKMLDGPLLEIEVGFYGHAAELDSQPLVAAVLAGLLQEHLEIPITRVNAAHLARRQGIKLSEIKAAEVRDYLSVLRVTARDAGGSRCLEGTLFDGRHPRLVRVNDYALEAPLEGHLIFTRHADQPGVIGTLGELLGREGVNISRMQVGAAEGRDSAIGVLAVSHPLHATQLAAIASIPAVDKVLQVDFSL